MLLYLLPFHLKYPPCGCLLANSHIFQSSPTTFPAGWAQSPILCSSSYPGLFFSPSHWTCHLYTCLPHLTKSTLRPRTVSYVSASLYKVPGTVPGANKGQSPACMENMTLQCNWKHVLVHPMVSLNTASLFFVEMTRPDSSLARDSLSSTETCLLFYLERSRKYPEIDHFLNIIFYFFLMLICFLIWLSWVLLATLRILHLPRSIQDL